MRLTCPSPNCPRSTGIYYWFLVVPIYLSLQACGVNRTEKIVLKPKKPQAEENECDICRANVYISWIKCDDDSIYCLQHAVKYLKNNRIKAKQCKLLFMYKKEEIDDIIGKMTEKIAKRKIEGKK